MPKFEGGPFGLFQHPFRQKNVKKYEGGPSRHIENFSEKSLTVPKKFEETL